MIGNFSQDILFHILKFTHIKDIHNLKITSKNINDLNIFSSDYLWKYIINRNKYSSVYVTDYNINILKYKNYTLECKLPYKSMYINIIKTIRKDKKDKQKKDDQKKYLEKLSMMTWSEIARY